MMDSYDIIKFSGALFDMINMYDVTNGITKNTRITIPESVAVYSGLETHSVYVFYFKGYKIPIYIGTCHEVLIEEDVSEKIPLSPYYLGGCI